jgi:ferredoxin
MVELATDEKTPLRMKDGEFVFIDEESCIGCAMCATASPSSFLMLESGRARTFKQRREKDVATAIDVCPVNCMHKVGFEELKEMETARDNGDGRSDHRHMGHRNGHTPLSVAGIDSDANHKSSWYHYLKNKCYTSSSCPKRGCYDCPNFRNPGDNPYFKEKQKIATRARMTDMMASGDTDLYRKTAEL